MLYELGNERCKGICNGTKTRESYAVNCVRLMRIALAKQRDHYRQDNHTPKYWNNVIIMYIMNNVHSQKNT